MTHQEASLPRARSRVERGQGMDADERTEHDQNTEKASPCRGCGLSKEEGAEWDEEGLGE